MKLLHIILALGVLCPLDGAACWRTGRERTRHGEHQCQYEHVHFRIHADGLLTEEPHKFWSACEAQ